METDDARYARWRAAAEGRWWKRVLDVQRPYRVHLKRLNLGFVLDLGCGVGRNLGHLDGNAVGVDHNAEAVRMVRARGFEAFLPDDFHRSRFATEGGFDAILCAHVLEHLTGPDGDALLASYLPYLRPSGRMVLMTPQERGYASDPTHVTFVDFEGLSRVEATLGVEGVAQYSFPFPRWCGRSFKYNEFISISRKRGGSSSTDAG